MPSASVALAVYETLAFSTLFYFVNEKALVSPCQMTELDAQVRGDAYSA